MAEAERHDVDVAVIGAGPAGLSAALNLVRARRRVHLLDSNRPRHSATLVSHGFLTRDGVSPLELRRIGREEVEGYASASVAQALVRSLVHDGDRFVLSADGVRGAAAQEVTANAVLIASGLGETLPALPSMRAYYGTALHSCIECDGFDKADAPLALIGDTDDLADWALRIAHLTDDLVVFTNGSDAVTADEERMLTGAGVSVERGAIRDVVGERAMMTGVELADGRIVARAGGFVRPHWSASVSYLTGPAPETDADGLLVVDAGGRTSVPGLYAAGDIVPPGPQQLIIAAGSGALVAKAVHRDLLAATARATVSPGPA